VFQENIMSVEATAPAVGPRSAPPQSAPKAWNIAFWVVQVLLAASFGMAGFMKMTAPIAELAEKMVWPGVVPPALVRFIGLSEFTAALGLILPAATRIKPVLTPLAGVGLVIIMVLAAIFHVTRGEFGALPTNFVYGALAAFVAWGRLRKAPILPR
jgi:putative oxidoreductase